MELVEFNIKSQKYIEVVISLKLKENKSGYQWPQKDSCPPNFFRTKIILSKIVFN